jgi:hypothetical protein
MILFEQLPRKGVSSWGRFQLVYDIEEENNSLERMEKAHRWCFGRTMACHYLVSLSLP